MQITGKYLCCNISSRLGFEKGAKLYRKCQKKIQNLNRNLETVSIYYISNLTYIVSVEGCEGRHNKQTVFVIAAGVTKLSRPKLWTIIILTLFWYKEERIIMFNQLFSYIQFQILRKFLMINSLWKERCVYISSCCSGCYSHE